MDAPFACTPLPQVHVFSTYFYKRLTDRSLAVGEDRSVSADKRRHQRVSKVDTLIRRKLN
jgi:Ulp1 family protease